ncbi:hypothetical protein [Pseudokineococcus sp. 1T1Z-3]|uniref:hypothetical protein n=1 Tax=Pseudokineococcus sp. 1T1Z-3 TaxID=3132745 RepID=UPI0030B69A74
MDAESALLGVCEPGTQGELVRGDGGRRRQDRSASWWKAVALDPGLRQDYLDSLALARDLDFDVLVPWGATDDGPAFAMTDRRDTRDRIDAIIARISAGGVR